MSAYHIHHEKGWHAMAMFLYPHSRQFPFDETCEQIVRALEEQGWNAAGITVGFHNYGDSKGSYRMVSCIEGEGFRLQFRRVQARMGRWNDIAAVAEILIPKKELCVYEDESGPAYVEYVGRNWKADKERFNGLKVHSKLRGEPRTYLKYKGACDCPAIAGASFGAHGFLGAALAGDKRALAELTHTHRGRRSPVLVHDEDLGREYSPRGSEPRMYRTDEVFAEFTQWLKANVLLPLVLTRPF